MEIVNVSDGVYTGLQVHATPSLAALWQFVPKHRAAHMLIEVRGGVVVDTIRTTGPVVSKQSQSKDVASALADYGVERVLDTAPAAKPVADSAARAEIEAMRADNEKLRGLVERLLAAQNAASAPAAPTPAPAPVEAAQPEPEPEDDGLDLPDEIPSWDILKSMDKKIVTALCKREGAPVGVVTGNVAKQRGWLHRNRKD
jgi:acetyl-CoA carboxylase carboxyltransferase component